MGQSHQFYDDRMLKLVVFKNYSRYVPSEKKQRKTVSSNNDCRQSSGLMLQQL